MVECKTTIEQCVHDIDNWMVINKLKLNQDKTEVVLISSRYRPWPPLDSLQIANLTVVPSSSARNLGIIFGKCFNFEDHIKSICKSSHYHIRNIAKIRKYTDEESPKIVVHAFVTSKLDSCNSLLYGFPQHLIKTTIYSKQSGSSCYTYYEIWSYNRHPQTVSLATCPLPYSF